MRPQYNLEKPTYRRLRRHSEVGKDIDDIVGVRTILNIGLLLLTPVIYLLALGSGIARQSFKVEGNTFLSSNYLL